MNPARAAKFFPLLALQPNVVMNNRLGGGVQGDLNTPEQHIPPTGFPGRDWETCMTINNTWGYKTRDTNFKSTTTLIRNLCDIASKGGNYLLNVGPTAEGLIPQPEIDRLKAMGTWLQTNGDAIYASTASPFPRQLAFGRATQKPGVLFLSVFDWPTDGTLVVPIGNTVTRASLLADPKTDLKFTATPDGVRITVPTAAPDAVASVVALEINGPVQPLPIPVPQDQEKGTISLDATTADLHGDAKLSLSQNTQTVPYVGGVSGVGGTVSWPVLVRTAGKFEVAVSCRSAGPAVATLTVGTAAVAVPIKVGGAKLVTVKAGPVVIGKPGVIQMMLLGPAGTTPLDVASVTLTPVK
jgi:alpha-L-fucosidase